MNAAAERLLKRIRDEFAVRAQLDDRSLRPEPDAFASRIFKARAVFGQEIETAPVFRLQPLRHLEAVDHDRIAPSTVFSRQLRICSVGTGSR